eukprot:CAMPEP_0113702870 /NCGR_PEP_ID=MMETSP0038_2-20120614/25481_1 /TAXON_ID=2898 /ORGANISM="Cryptomonas paramecium" /LENGTH=333 /DNA_ID=CAMNT_0000627143 /DNA_START=1 /DNA_END=999 /DNA_ORIENTATION=- /assembly_acc=CAM_ASM_000170
MDRDALRKEQERTKTIQLRKSQVAAERRARQAQHDKRMQRHVEAERLRKEEEHVVMERKMEQADKNLQELMERNTKKVVVNQDLHHVRNEIFKRKKERLEASRFFWESKRRERFEREQQMDDLLNNGRRLVREHRVEQAALRAYDREIIADLVSEFERDGTFERSLAKHTGSAERLPRLLQVLFAGSDLADLDGEAGEDKNRLATQMPLDQPVEGMVQAGATKYYKLRCTSSRASIFLQLRRRGGGDPDLFVGNSKNPNPTNECCDWHSSGFGGDKIVIHYFDRHYVRGWFYIGVYGASKLPAEFSLTASIKVWKAPEDAARGGADTARGDPP